MGFMLFSRSKPSTDDLAALLRRDGQDGAASGVNVARELAVQAVVPALPLLQDLGDVPTGRYASFESLEIPSTFKESFAVLFTGETSVMLVTAAEAFKTHPQYELQRRLQVEHGVRTVEVRQATRTIVNIIHGQNKAVTAVQNTDVETAAWSLVEDALKKDASDIHIETREPTGQPAYAQVWFRINGERVEQPIMTKDGAMSICQVLAGVHADADNKGVDWDHKTVQDTVVPYTSSSGIEVQLRFSSSPIFPSGNFHAVMRVIPMDPEKGRALEEIGYTAAQVAAIEECLLGSQGLVGLLGPTNSGKSSSMQAFIERTYERRGDWIKVITVEDPVEYVISRACQSGVVDKNDGNSGYKALLKGTLRQDPDAVMAGEIRDAEGAANVMHLVLAGRKLFTTMHVYEAMAAFTRLREIGVPESVLYMAGFVSVFVCQRLVPLLCPDCSISIVEAMQKGRLRRATFDRVSRVANLAEDNICVRGDGCPTCNYRGITGRTPCAEVLVPDATFLALMAQGKLLEARNHWMTNSTHLDIDGNGVTMIAHAIHKMRKGLVDPGHVETHIGPIVVDSPVAGGTPPGFSRSDLPKSLQ